MYRAVFFSLVSILVSCPALRATPINYVWFEGKSLNQHSGIQTQGVKGSDLHLTCDTTDGPVNCKWSIAMQMSSEVQFGSMGTNMLGNTSKYSVSNIEHGNYPSNGYNFQAINSGGTLTKFKEVNVPVFGSPPQCDPLDGGPGKYLLNTWTLTGSQLQGFRGVENIDAAINELLWASVTCTGPNPQAYVQFGSSAPIHGGIQGLTASGVIVVHNESLLKKIDFAQAQNIPEPGSCCLIMFGLMLACARRRAN